MSEARADPDRLLANVQAEELRGRRGRLKVFLGMAPGVGKTYAMLEAAHRLAEEGHDVVVGVVETHGRIETEQQLLGLDLLPRRSVEYRGVTLQELDLDAALARKPEILLIDELAHTNAPGGRFEKRWEDVRELRNAGISVFTTLNVQHVESLNDVVAQITGVQVRETVPDSVLDEADEVELVDLPPEALIERLKAGKVYVPQTIQHAIDSFFRKSNLASLRQLALRRTAEWVDRQMREDKQAESATAVWPAVDRVLVCVSPSPKSADLVRAAKRMAAGLRADLIAVYIERRNAAQLAPADLARVRQTLQLAESLGAEAITLGAPAGRRDTVGELIALAKARKVTKIIIGKTEQPRWRAALFGSLMDAVIRRSGDIDVHVIRTDAEAAEPEAHLLPAHLPGGRRSRLDEWSRSLLHAVFAVTVTSAIAALVDRFAGPDNIAMLYLLGVVAVALWGDRLAAILAAILSVAVFDFVFVPPRWTFAVSDAQYLITFIVMVIVGLAIAGLSAQLRLTIDAVRQRERRAMDLYSLSRALAAAADRKSIALAAVKHVRDAFNADAMLLVPGAATDLRMLVPLAETGSPDWLDDRERGAARWSFEHGKVAGCATSTLPASQARYVPLHTARGKLGVLAVRTGDWSSMSTTQLLLLDTFADQIALALERIQWADMTRQAQVAVEKERLRSALLSSVSHDLRTPLTGIAGSAGALLQSDDSLSISTRRELAESIVTESQRLNELIGNLMFATRLESGVEIKREWTTIEEVVGAGLNPHREALARRPFRTVIPRDLPMIRGDASMLSQVIHNLIDNALRYTPDGTTIQVSAWATDQNVIVQISDEGPGLSPGEQARVFDRLYRSAAAQSHRESGLGLGLTIAEGIVKAHGGRIWVEPNKPHGAAFHVALPIERPQPEVPTESPDVVSHAGPSSQADSLSGGIS